MKITDILPGHCYRTTIGNGTCIAVGGHKPYVVQMSIVSPAWLGRRFLRPRDVITEITEPFIMGELHAREIIHAFPGQIVRTP